MSAYFLLIAETVDAMLSGIDQCNGGRTELLSYILRFAIASRGKNSYRLTQSIRTLITLRTAYHIVRTLSIWTSEFYTGLHDTQAYRLSQRFPNRGSSWFEG